MSYKFTLNKKSKGFTLIEIVVSLAIIGILFSIGIISYGNWKYKATVAQTKSDLLQLSSAFEDYRNNNKAFPTDVSVLSNFKSSNGITITGGSSNGFYYCLNAASATDSSLVYHITSDSKEILSGSCPVSSWKSVSLGWHNTCAISSDDKAYCWGLGSSGELGNGTTNSSNIPVAILKGDMSSLSVKQIAAGSHHTCAISSNDAVYCWGSSSYGALGRGPAGSSSLPKQISLGAMASLSVKQISVNNDTFCVVGFDDKPYCWGSNSLGNLGDGTTINRSIPTAVVQGVMPSLNVKQISVTASGACVLNFDDRVYCWGYNSSGQLGNGSTTSSLSPVALSQGDMPSYQVKKISYGTYSYHVCAINYNDNLYCWGNNGDGGVGDGTSYNDRLTPKAVLLGDMSSLSIKKVTTGQELSCAINVNDDIYCWGNNSKGSIGDGTFISRSRPTKVAKNGSGSKKFLDVYIGGENARVCAISINGDLYCWGFNDYGSIGLGYRDYINDPVLVQQGSMVFQSVKQISLGYNHSCAISINEKAYCWGNDIHYQIGDGKSKAFGGGLSTEEAINIPNSVVPGSMPSEVSIKQISTSNNSTCVIASDNKLYCWGYNSDGQLGDGTRTYNPKPVAVALGARPSNIVKQIAVASQHACAIASDDRVYCWGSNYNGRLGNNSTSESYIPVAVSQGAMSSMTVKSISAYDSNTCVISSNDNVYCWGAGGYGQLGNGSTVSSSVPVAVSQGAMPSLNVKSLSVGSGHACVIASNDNTYCWGYNYNGQLGNNTTTNSSIPVGVLQGTMPTKTVTSISTGRYGSCAILTNGLLYCWGYGDHGLLTGSSNLYAQTTPVKIIGTNIGSLTFKQVSMGAYHSCAIALDNKVYCWGNNEYGQLGMSTHSIFDHNIPKLVKHP